MSPDDPGHVLSKSQHYLHTLESWKKSLQADLAWDDSAVQSTIRNVARMRAEYYRALYMVLLPCLQAAIALGLPRKDRKFNCSTSVHTEEYIDVQMAEPKRHHAKMFDYACICINAAVQSTTAFDRVGASDDSAYSGRESTRTQRLVLPNIFGTMHSRFGNVLILAEVYQSKMYQHLPHDTLLTPNSLAAMFERTISALEEIAPNSPTLQIDLQILQNARTKLRLPSKHCNAAF
jgi:hypothetical protein